MFCVCLVSAVIEFGPLEPFMTVYLKDSLLKIIHTVVCVRPGWVDLCDYIIFFVWSLAFIIYLFNLLICCVHLANI